MSKYIRDMISYDCRSLLKNLTGLDFIFSQSGPERAQFTLRAQGVDDMESHQIEWLVKCNSGILLISEPITKMDFWNIPEDMYTDTLDRHEAERQIREDYSCFIEDLEQAVYAASGKLGVNIKLDKSEEPRVFVFLGNNKTDDDLINSISAMDYLLPQLLATA